MKYKEEYISGRNCFRCNSDNLYRFMEKDEEICTMCIDCGVCHTTTLDESEHEIAKTLRTTVKLKQIIRDKIYLDELKDDETPYRGLDMSGYNNSFIKNMGLIAEFSNYMKPEYERRDVMCVMPIFWKGSGSLVRFSNCCFDDNSINPIENISNITGWETEEIIADVIIRTYPDIINKLFKEDDLITRDIDEALEDLIIKNPNYEKTQIIKKFKRDTKLVKEKKKKHQQCQICDFTFKKENGENYNEVHHIISLSKNGKDAALNTLVLCANCHKQLHYAKVDITKILEGIIIINGVKKTISK